MSDEKKDSGEASNVNNTDQTAVTNVGSQDNKTDDLLKRVTSFQQEQASQQTDEQSTFNINDIQKIEDPKARELAMQAYSSLNKGFQEKYRELAELRKHFEGQINKKQEWTPQSIQDLLKDPTFVRAAEQVAGSTTDEEYSSLSENEQKMLSEVYQQMEQMKVEQQKSKINQEHEALRNKYADYNPQQIESIRNDLMSGKIQATNEHLYRAFNFEQAVKKAYELGKTDRNNENAEKVKALSPEGFQVRGGEDPVIKSKGESDMSVWQKIVHKNLKAKINS